MNSMQKLNITESDLHVLQQHCIYVDPEDPIGFDYAGMWITNIFLDSSGRFELNLTEAIQEYGFENVNNFAHQVIQ